MDQNFKHVGQKVSNKIDTHTHTHTHLCNFYHSSNTKEELEGDEWLGVEWVVLAHEYKDPCYCPLCIIAPPCVAPTLSSIV